MFRIFVISFFAVFVFTAAAKDITYKLDGKNYEGHLLKRSNNAPAVFLIHDWDSLTGYELRRSQMLLDMGYSVFAIYLFGKGIRPTVVKDKKQHTGELYKDRKKMRAIMNGALASAKAQGLNTKNAVVMGYCFGGAAALEWARSGQSLKAFITFHGGLTTPKGQSYKNTKGSVVIFHGSADANITLDHFAQLGKSLEKDGIPHR